MFLSLFPLVIVAKLQMGGALNFRNFYIYFYIHIYIIYILYIYIYIYYIHIYTVRSLKMKETHTHKNSVFRLLVVFPRFYTFAHSGWLYVCVYIWQGYPISHALLIKYIKAMVSQSKTSGE